MKQNHYKKVLIISAIFIFLILILNVNYSPSKRKILSFDTLPNGLLQVSYDSDDNGIADFYEIRIIVMTIVSDLSLSKMKKKYEKYNIFHTKETSLFYITEFPLFYGIDDDEDGKWKYIKNNH